MPAAKTKTAPAAAKTPKAKAGTAAKAAEAVAAAKAKVASDATVEHKEASIIAAMEAIVAAITEAA